MSMKKIQLFGDSVEAISPSITRQRRVNCYFEIVQQGEKDVIAIRGTPGQTLLITLPDEPIRGGKVARNYFYVVAGNSIYQVCQTGGYVKIGDIYSTDTTKPVSMDINETQVMIVDGEAGYVFNYDLIDTAAATATNRASMSNIINNSQALHLICQLTGNT